jgi:hypothetical protein
MAITSAQQSSKLRAKWHGVNDDRIVAIEVEHAEFEQRSVRRWPDEHRQVLIHPHSAHRVAKCVVDVSSGTPCLRAGAPIRT